MGMSTDRLVSGSLRAASRSSDGRLDASGLDHRGLNEDRCGGDPILSAGFCRRLSEGCLHHQRAVVCMKTRSILAAGLVVTFFSVPAQADVWEFDRQGNVLASPNPHLTYNITYVTNVTADTPKVTAVRSSRPARSPPAGHRRNAPQSRSSPNSSRRRRAGLGLLDQLFLEKPVQKLAVLCSEP